MRWYLRGTTGAFVIGEMMKERGLSIVHTTIMRWIYQYVPELNKRICRHLKPINDSCFESSCHHSEKESGYPISNGGVEERKIIEERKKMPIGTQVRQVKYLNNIVEQDHRFIKKRVHSMLGLKSFRTAKSIISVIEVMYIVKNGKLFYRTSLSKIK